MTAGGPELGLAGRHLLLTGAGGLGRVLAADALELGMVVTLVDRDPDALASVPRTPRLRTAVG
jgi:Trk K+ transport system NAD-binding subunit